MAAKRPGSASLPESYLPQLATLVKEPPAGDSWLHELKYDGYRIGCRIEGDEVTLLSRRGKDWTAAFAEIRTAARALGVQRALLDGEVAVLLPDGRTSFQALQNAFGGGERAGLTYFVFDLLHLDGQDLMGRPLEERKQVLETLLTGRPAGNKSLGRIRYSEHVVGHGATFLAHACRLGLEGIVSKQRALPYQGGRSSSWVKCKCTRRQELVVGGFTDPEGSRQGIGALLLGAHDAEGRLSFAGKVGTGFTHRSARELRERLEALEQATCPFDPRPTGNLGGTVHWVRPKLVAEISFGEWTGDGKVRHASFQGLRVDKPAREVVREQETAPPGEDPPPAKKPRPRPSDVRSKAPPKAAGEEIEGVRISHPERLLYPAVGLTKLDLAHFYQAVMDWVLPQVQGRPLTLVRCPQGLTGGDNEGCFFMKHSGPWAPPALRRIHLAERTKTGEYLVADDPAGLIALVQMDVLEIHTWNSVADKVEHPSRVVFDLDPGPEVPWAEVVEAARFVREALVSLELQSFVKTTGGKGLHVVVPLAPERSWDETLTFTRDLSAAIAARHPGRYTISVPKAGREKKILIDFLRNSRGATSVAAYSTRARSSATVSTPLSWDELSPRLPPDRFTVATVLERIRRLRRDPWDGYGRSRQRLTPAVLKAVTRLR